MNAYAKIILRTDFTKKDGTKPICLRITIDRKVKVYSLNIAVSPDHWNFEKSGVKKNHPHSGKYNLVIQNALNKANQIIFDYSLGNKVLSFSDFQIRFFNPRFHSNDFYGFVEYQIQKTTGIISPETLRTHKAHLSKLRKFKETLSFDEIHFQFIESYKKHMITQLGNNENTWNKSLAFLKLMLNRAIKEGIIKGI